MRDDATASAAMLGLPGFRVLAVAAYAGEVEQAVETVEEVTGCPSCGVVAQLHDRRPSWVRDLPAGGRPVTLVWVKRVWRCREPWCPKVTWTETSAAIRPRASLTERARREACRRVGQDGHTVAGVAADFGVGWATVMAAVREYGTPLVDDPHRLHAVAALGVDETAFLAATPTRSTTYATGIVALNGRPRLLDVVHGRSGNALSSWVCAQDQRWRDGIGVAALDPFRGYATALRTTLPGARRVLDAFHVTRLGFDALDQVRRRVQQHTLGHRGHRNDPLFRIRRVLRRGGRAPQPAVLGPADRRARGRRSRPAGRPGLDRRPGPTADLPVQNPSPGRTPPACLVHRSGRTRDPRTPAAGPNAGLLAQRTTGLRFDTGGVSNGPTEAINGLIKKIKRIGHGFRNFANYRLRLLLYCGVDWHTPRHPDPRAATTLSCVEPAMRCSRDG